MQAKMQVRQKEDCCQPPPHFETHLLRNNVCVCCYAQITTSILLAEPLQRPTLLQSKCVMEYCNLQSLLWL